MKIQTISSITEDSILKQIKALEGRGFFLHTAGFKSNAPRTHHKTREKRRREKKREDRPTQRSSLNRVLSGLETRRHLRVGTISGGVASGVSTPSGITRY